MYRQERFGYWPNKNLDDGRFLPIKFEGVEQLSSYLYNEYIVDPLCSMNDPGNYYVYYFAGWTYKKPNGEMPVDRDGYSLIQSMFRNSDNPYIFDILENPANYADDEGVIRLYPYFVGEGTYDSYATNDSTRISVNDDKNIKRFVFAGETHPDITYYTTGIWGNDEEYTISNISLAVSYNVPLDSNTKIIIDWMKKDDYSENKWNDDVFVIPGGDIVNDYGKGLYNFYIAVGYNGQDCNKRERNIDLDEFYNKLSFNNFDSTSAKNIIKYNKAFGDSDDGRHYNDHWHNGDNRAPLVIGFEKVTDIKIIEGIDTSGNYNDYIQSVYPTSANFSHTNLVDMPYAYLVRNIDLSDDVNKSFQLRFGENYISRINFNEPTDSIFVPIEQGSSTTQEFVPYADYFSLSNMNGQNFFSVKSELYYHIFDFLLIYENEGFSFYVYRHTDFFVKLYGSDITLDHDVETGMVLHSNIPSIWENRYGARQEINSSDVNTNSDINGSLSIEDTIRNHIATLEDNTLSEYVLLDHVTQSIVGYFDENDNFIFRSFIVNKNYILEVHYSPDLIKSLSLD